MSSINLSLTRFVKTHSNKLLLVVLLCLIVTILYNVFSMPFNEGYESSTYSGFPITFWPSIFLLLVIGIFVVIQRLFSSSYSSCSLIIGMGSVFIFYIIMLSLWMIRGYFLWDSGDPLTHLGIVNEILNSGHIETSNIYPIAHVLSVIISLIFNVPPTIPQKILPLIFGILNVPFLYLFAKSILPKKGQAIIATLLGMALLQGWYLNFTPNHLANLIFPLILLILVKSYLSDNASWSILLLIELFLLPMFHIVPAFALFVIMLSLFFFKKLRFNKQKSSDNWHSKYSHIVLILYPLWLVTWISSFYVWSSTIKNLEAFINEGGNTNLDLLRDQILYGTSYGYNILEYFIKEYGGICVLFLLSAISFFILLNKHSKVSAIKPLFAFFVPSCTFVILIILLYFLNLGFGPLRLMVYLVIICSVFSAFTIYKLLIFARRQKKSLFRMFSLFIAVFIILLLFLNGAMKLYPSQYTLEANQQVTKTETMGMNWFLNNNDVSIEMTAITLAPGRFSHFLLTSEERIGRIDLQNLSGGLYISNFLKVPYHFGYDTNSSLGDFYNSSTFLILTSQDRIIYHEIYPEIESLRYLPQDFARLAQDSTLDKLFSNGGLDVYLIWK